MFIFSDDTISLPTQRHRLATTRNTEYKIFAYFCSVAEPSLLNSGSAFSFGPALAQNGCTFLAIYLLKYIVFKDIYLGNSKSVMWKKYNCKYCRRG